MFRKRKVFEIYRQLVVQYINNKDITPGLLVKMSETCVDIFESLYGKKPPKPSDEDIDKIVENKVAAKLKEAMNAPVEFAEAEKAE
jgi:hypothetical protein